MHTRDQFVRKPVARREGLELFSRRNIQAGFRADPDSPLIIGSKTCYTLIQQPARFSELRDLSVRQFEQSIPLRAEPQVFLAVFATRRHVAGTGGGKFG